MSDEGSVGDGGVDNLNRVPEVRASMRAASNADHQIRAPTTEVADEVERDGRPLGSANRV